MRSRAAACTPRQISGRFKARGGRDGAGGPRGLIICLEAASAELRAQTIKLARHRGGHRSRRAPPPRSTVLVALPLPRVGTRRRRRLAPLVVQMISQLSGQPAFQGHSSSKAGSRPSVPVITTWIIPCVVEALIPRKGEGSCPRLGGTLMSSDGVRSGWCLGCPGQSGSAWGCLGRVGEGAGDQLRDPARLGPPGPDGCRRGARHHQVWRPSASGSGRWRSGSLEAGARSVGARRLFSCGGV